MPEKQPCSSSSRGKLDSRSQGGGGHVMYFFNDKLTWQHIKDSCHILSISLLWQGKNQYFNRKLDELIYLFQH